MYLVAFIIIWFLNKLQTKRRKERPKTGLKHVHLLHDNAPANKSSTVAQFLRLKGSFYCRTVPTTQTCPVRYCPVFDIEKQLSGVARRALGFAALQFLKGVPKDEYKIVSKMD